MRDRIQDLIKKGKTLKQVKAAKSTLDYDGLYGSPDMFVEAGLQKSHEEAVGAATQLFGGYD